ncbi:MAG: acyl-ACP thioesterase [Candidatus Poriferisodalaceae bacterium]
MGLTGSHDNPDFVEHPGVGRRFESTTTVRFGDADSSGRCRLDALATIVQDIAMDDWNQAAPDCELVWLMRRMAVKVISWPQIEEDLTMATWSSGVGRRWAERRTTLSGAAGASVETAAIWVCVDPSSGRPAAPPIEFEEQFVASAAGRKVDSKLRLPPEPSAEAAVVDWVTRSSDIDIIGHVNNAVYWQMAEEAWAPTLASGTPVLAVMEHRAAVDPDETPSVSADCSGLWCVVGERTATVGGLYR